MSTQHTPGSTPALRPPGAPGGLGTASYRLAVLLLLGINAWYLHGIKEALPGGGKLESYSSASRDRLPTDTKVLPVYVINGVDVNRIEGHGGNASYVEPLKLRLDDPFGLRVRIENQPVSVKVTP